jgi:hypothetical protein
MNPSRTAPVSLTVAAWLCAIAGICAMLFNPTGDPYLELTGRILFVAGIICWVIKAAQKRGR